MTDQKQREAAMERRVMRPVALAVFQAFNNEQKDWEAKCPVCGVQLRGTLAQLKEHKHGPAS